MKTRKHMSPIEAAESRKDLDDLLALAETYSKRCMRAYGSVSPMFFGQAPNPSGLLCFQPPALKDVQTKETFQWAARMICKAYDVRASVLALEAWVSDPPPIGSPAVPPPSEAVIRSEIVMLSGQARSDNNVISSKVVILPIFRNDVGGFARFGERKFEPHLEGRFLQILHPVQPTDEMRRRARQILDAHGITEAVLRPDHTRN